MESAEPKVTVTVSCESCGGEEPGSGWVATGPRRAAHRDVKDCVLELRSRIAALQLVIELLEGHEKR